ncbi:Wzz/FepE/Etk N-terminal domain-containing protein [uncultured Pseudokineococcus sp.]|uniref:Wzz/FepE/Etk N-terminal domain-containing protein n=1 Tax=uncultured Pseudokineococcus sp. TaxID=1642928 RepID=UPI00263A2998|nr:Wzz/FepE/Etk N-terminal domain-containing protein [uncultured Pseudokineococcus sp.]
MSSSSGTDFGSTDVADYGRRITRRWWLVLGGVALGLAGGAAATWAQTPLYTSTTSVLVESPSTGADQRSAEINLDTEAQLVRSTRLADEVRARLNVDLSTTEVREAVTVTVPPNSQVLDLTFSASTAEDAQAGASAYAEVYLDQREAVAEQRVQDTIDSLTAQLASLREDLDQSATPGTVLPGSTQQLLAESQRDIIISQITDLNSRLAPLRATAVEAGEVISPAGLPRSPTSPVLLLDLVAGALVGLLLGLVAALAADRLDRRVRRASDLERAAAVPVLAEVRDGDLRGAALCACHDRDFDLIRNELTSADPTLRAVQVQDLAGGGPGAACSARLAAALHRTTGSGTLVLASAESPLASWLALDGRPGLADVLRGDVPLEDVWMRSEQLGGVVVLPPGRSADDLADLVQSPRFTDVFTQLLRDQRGGVVVDTPGADTSPGAQSVSRLTDAVVLVARAGETGLDRARTAASVNERMGARVSGAVLVAGPRRGAPRHEHRDGTRAASAAPTTSRAHR